MATRAERARAESEKTGRAAKRATQQRGAKRDVTGSELYVDGGWTAW